MDLAAAFDRVSATAEAAEAAVPLPIRGATR